MKQFYITILFLLILVCGVSQFRKQASILPGGADKWKLIWQDEFTYSNNQLDEEWEAENGANKHILCSRWRENAVVSDGTLKLINKKEKRGGRIGHLQISGQKNSFNMAILSVGISTPLRVLPIILFG